MFQEMQLLKWGRSFPHTPSASKDGENAALEPGPLGQAPAGDSPSTSHHLGTGEWI